MWRWQLTEVWSRRYSWGNIWAKQMASRQTSALKKKNRVLIFRQIWFFFVILRVFKQSFKGNILEKASTVCSDINFSGSSNPQWIERNVKYWTQRRGLGGSGRICCLKVCLHCSTERNRTRLKIIYLQGLDLREEQCICVYQVERQNGTINYFR